MHLYFHFYSHYTKVYICRFIKFRTFGFILKKSTTVAIDFHFHSDYMISYACLSHAHSIYTVLTVVWHLEMKHDHSSLLANLSAKAHTQLCLLLHRGSLTGKQTFLLPDTTYKFPLLSGIISIREQLEICMMSIHITATMIHSTT
jgi:hypothetical protein